MKLQKLKFRYFSKIKPRQIECGEKVGTKFGCYNMVLIREVVLEAS
jgi:hypothetical protein